MDENFSPTQERTIKLIVRLCENQQYQEALDVLKRNPTQEDAKRCLLYRLLNAVDRVEDPSTLGEGHREALFGLLSISPELNTFPFHVNICISYYPHKVPAMFATFMRTDAVDQNKLLENIFAAFEHYLDYLLFVHCLVTRYNPNEGSFLNLLTEVQRDIHQRVCPCSEEETCISMDFASFVLSACKPLHYGSSFDVEFVHLDTSSRAGHYPLFCKTISNDMLPEAILLYETGAVNNSELAFMAQRKPEIQKMLDENKDTPMATFLRSVMRQPRSLLSAASLEVSILLGHDVRGRQDRAKSLELPHTVYNEVMFIRQASDYRCAVTSR